MQHLHDDQPHESLRLGLPLRESIESGVLTVSAETIDSTVSCCSSPLESLRQQFDSLLQQHESLIQQHEESLRQQRESLRLPLRESIESGVITESAKTIDSTLCCRQSAPFNTPEPAELVECSEPSLSLDSWEGEIPAKSAELFDSSEASVSGLKRKHATTNLVVDCPIAAEKALPDENEEPADGPAAKSVKFSLSL